MPATFLDDGGLLRQFKSNASTDMNEQIAKINTQIAPLRHKITTHPVYEAITDLEDLKIFMQHHIYAVWDFMSLLKSLQRELTCISLPWFPTGSADTRYLINEIVVGEESDVDMDGNRTSHFELYLAAMKQCGADTGAIETFIAQLQATGDFPAAYTASETPAAARQFVDYTFQIINSGRPDLQAAIFTFGREDLIPDMFIAMVSDISKRFPDSLATFKYYLERHIEVDGDHHSHLALAMTANLCGTDTQRWEEAEAAVIASLESRLALWDGALQSIQLRREKSSWAAQEA